MRRKSKATKLELDERQKELLSQLTSEFMTDEESGDEGTLIARHILWRSEELNQFISLLDSVPTDPASVQKKRVDGPPSTRTPCHRAPRELIET